ncbi:MAG: hypothetical protein K6G89_05355 [Clostridia bacterium]|nr:hypothetical protein [Clostridia bacterium]
MLLTLIYVLVAGFATCNVIYADDAIDSETAVALVKNARDIMRSFRTEFQWFITNPDGTDDAGNDIFVDGFNGRNMVSYFRPVRDGFDAEGVKKLIGDTFAKPVADNYLAHESFFGLYYSQDGKLYYYISYGSQLGDFSNLELTDEDIEGLSIVDPCTAAVRTKFLLPFDDWFNGEVTVFFSFEKETDGWKVKGMDASGAPFRSYDKEYDLSAFSEEVAKTGIRALLGEVYRLAHVDGGEFVYYFASIDDANDSEATHISRFGHEYYRVNGTEGKTETWLAYASRFASEEIAGKLVQDGRYCVSENGRMYYRERNSGDSYPLAAYCFRPEILDNMELDIVSQTDTGAVVKAKLPTADKQEVEITFEFTRIDGQWKVSGGDFIEVLDAVYAPENGSGDGSFLSKNELEALIDDAMLVRSMLGAGRYPWNYNDPDLQFIYVFEEKEGITSQYVYRPAIEGFNETGIRALVYKTLCGDYADKVLARNKAFFDGFKEIDGTMYFREWGYTLSNGYKEYQRDKDRDIVVVEKTDEKAAVDVHFLPDLTVRVFLANENGSWKVSSYDNSQMLLTADPELMKSDDFSGEMALEALKAVIMEGYYYTSIAGSAANTYYELGGGTTFLEGSLALPETWKQYLAGFSTSEIADKVLFKNDTLKLRDDGLMERNKTRGTIDMYLSANALSADRLTVTAKGDGKATCVYNFGHSRKDICSLTVEFSKTDNGWRISGGDFVEKLQGAFFAESNPDTSDSGIFAIVIAVLLLPAVVLKKRFE